MAAVALNRAGEHSSATYYLDLGGSGRCSALTTEEARGADGMIGFMFSNRSRFTEPLEKMSCPGPRAREHYLRFRDGLLHEIAVPGQSSPR